jgi:hypothetical protein
LKIKANFAPDLDEGIIAVILFLVFLAAVVIAGATVWILIVKILIALLHLLRHLAH